MELAENPYSPMFPLLQGWVQAHPRNWERSDWSSGPVVLRAPPLSPVPRHCSSMVLKAVPTQFNVLTAGAYGLSSTMSGRGASEPDPSMVACRTVPSEARNERAWLTVGGGVGAGVAAAGGVASARPATKPVTVIASATRRAGARRGSTLTGWLAGRSRPARESPSPRGSGRRSMARRRGHHPNRGTSCGTR